MPIYQNQQLNPPPQNPEFMNQQQPQQLQQQQQPPSTINTGVSEFFKLNLN